MAGTISGKVTNAQDNSAIQGATVTADFGGVLAGRAVTHPPGGTYKILNLAAGVFTLTATAPGFQPLTKQNIAVQDGQDTGNTDFSLPATPAGVGSITGKVSEVDVQGQRTGVANALVTATNRQATVILSAVTGAQGDYGLANLAPDTYTVAVTATGYEIADPKADVKVVAGQPTKIDFDLLSAGDANFRDLVRLITGPDFAPEPQINLEEAREFRRLLTVGVYVLAKVPEGIARLDELLRDTAPAGTNNHLTLALINRPALHQRYSASIQQILRDRVERPADEAAVLEQVRAKFNIGTAAVASVNGEFGPVYKEVVTLCADDLMGTDPDEVTGKFVFDAKQREEVSNFLKKVKRTLIRLAQNMSAAGTRGTRPIVQKWSKLLEQSLTILRDVGRGNVASDDKDDRHIVSVLAALTNAPRPATKAYFVHARDGGDLLDLVIDTYTKIQNDNRLDDEAPKYLRDLFYGDGVVVPGQKLNVLLKERALRLKDNWLSNWA